MDIRKYSHLQLRPVRRKQKGATLIVALIILLVLSISTASALQNITLQERMAANMLDNTLAFHAAEDALLGAETWLLDKDATRTVNPFILKDSHARAASPEIYSVTDDPDQGLKHVLIDGVKDAVDNDVSGLSHWQSYAWPASEYGVKSSEWSQNAMVTVEKIAAGQYRVLVRSAGASGHAEVILESVVNK